MRQLACAERNKAKIATHGENSDRWLRPLDSLLPLRLSFDGDDSTSFLHILDTYIHTTTIFPRVVINNIRASKKGRETIHNATYVLQFPFFPKTKQQDETGSFHESSTSNPSRTSAHPRPHLRPSPSPFILKSRASPCVPSRQHLAVQSSAMETRSDSCVHVKAVTS